MLAAIFYFIIPVALSLWIILSSKRSKKYWWVLLPCVAIFVAGPMGLAVGILLNLIIVVGKFGFKYVDGSLESKPPKKQ